MTKPCHLMVDSTCDLPFSLIDRDDITLASLSYFFGDDAYADDLWQSQSAEDFFGRMRAGEKPTTSQASALAMEEAFRNAAKAGIPTVYIAFASKLSATCDQGFLAAEKVRQEFPDAEIYVVDSGLTSVSEGLLFLEVLRMRDEGKSAKEIAEWAEEAKNFVNFYFMVDDPEPLKRGGRVTEEAGMTESDTFDVKPILTSQADGTFTQAVAARGRKKALKALAEIYANNAAPYNNAANVIALASADYSEGMEALRELLEETPAYNAEDQNPTVIESSIGPVIGAHMGPGVVALAFWGQDKRRS